MVAAPRARERSTTMLPILVLTLAIPILQAQSKPHLTPTNNHHTSHHGHTSEIQLADELRHFAEGYPEPVESIWPHAPPADPTPMHELATAMLADGELRLLADPADAHASRRTQGASPTPPTASLASSGRISHSRAKTVKTDRPIARALHAPRRAMDSLLPRRLQDSSAECPAPEPARLAGASGRMHQLNFSAMYNSSPTCTWVVTCSKAQAFVRFSSFSSEYNGFGEYAGYSDVLSLYDGDDFSAPLLGVLCGAETPTAFVAESGSMILELQYTFPDTTPSFEVEYWCAAGSGIVPGCTDPLSPSFNSAATADDGSCHAHERQALMDAFQLDPSSRALSGWSATGDPCSCGSAVWEGVVCYDDRRITEIDLHARDVKFTLGEGLGELTSLVWLSLWGSGLHGTMPRALGSMTFLQTVEVDHTELSGTIPPITAHSLTHVHAYTTRLSGSIPREISSLTGLESVMLSETYISGTLPEDIGRLLSLAVLDVNGSALSGSLPRALGEMSALQCLSISNTHFNGHLPSTMEGMASLWSLTADQTDISGTLVDALTRIQTFRSVVPWSECCSVCTCCRYGQLQETLELRVDAEGRLRRQLSLGGSTGISGTLIDGMSDMKGLGGLELTNTRLSGTIGAAIGGMTSLQAFSAAGTHVSGTFGKELAGLTQLERLQIYAAPVSGTIPSAVRALTSMRILDLPDTRISGTIPAAIGTHLNVLQELSVYNCHLSGTLPPQLGQLGELISLFVDSNALNGAIPDLSGCRSLKVMRMTNNSFGSLPAAIPGSITHLYLDKNPLNATAVDLSMTTRGLVNLHTLSVGIFNLPIILESSITYPDPRCNVPIVQGGCRGTWITKPASCRVGQPCSWQLQLRDADDQEVHTGGLLSDLSIMYCNETSSMSCAYNASMTDNHDGTFTATVPPSWIQMKGQHSFRFFHEGREFHPSMTSDNTRVSERELRTVQYSPIECEADTNTIPNEIGSECICKPDFAPIQSHSKHLQSANMRCQRTCDPMSMQIVSEGQECACLRGYAPTNSANLTSKCERCETWAVCPGGINATQTYCPAGKQAVGGTVCENCPPGKAGGGSSECRPCLPTSEVATEDRRACECRHGYYAPDGQTCVKCSEVFGDSAVVCPGGSPETAGAYPRPGLWMSTTRPMSMNAVYKCFPPDVCAGKAPNDDVNATCQGPWCCKANHTGILCGECISEDFIKSDGRCLDCTNGTNWWIVIAAVISYTLLGKFLQYKSADLDVDKNGSALTILTFYLQSLHLFSTSNYRTWGALLVDFDMSSSDAGSTKCKTSLSPNASAVVSMVLIPVYLCCTSYFFAHRNDKDVVAQAHQQVIHRRWNALHEVSLRDTSPLSTEQESAVDLPPAERMSSTTRWRQIAAAAAPTLTIRAGVKRGHRAVLEAAAFCYMGVTKKALSVLFCKSVDGKSLVAYDVSQECHNTQHLLLSILATIALLCYSIGFPLQIVRKARADRKKRKTRAQTTFVRLLCLFDDKYTWWMAWLLLRRALIVGAFLYGRLVADDIGVDGVHINWRSIAFLILGLSAVLHTWCVPFKLDEDDKLEQVTLAMLMVSVYFDVADTSDQKIVSAVVDLLSMLAVGGIVGAGDTPGQIVHAIASGLQKARLKVSKCCGCNEDSQSDLSTNITDTERCDDVISPAGTSSGPGLQLDAQINPMNTQGS